VAGELDLSRNRDDGCVRGGAQAGFAALSAWPGGLFLAWTALANAAVLGFGVAVVHSGYPAAWPGWLATVLAALMLAQLTATGARSRPSTTSPPR
jgi:hypothetical protein